MMRRPLLLTVTALLVLTGSSRAQEPAYAEDLRFVQAPRQSGDTDLAKELLDRLKKTASPQLQRELPFEYALTFKAEALIETDSKKRLDLYAQARADLIKFRDSNPNHPRVGDVKIDIADIAVLEGRVEMSKAMAQEGLETQVAARLSLSRNSRRPARNSRSSTTTWMDSSPSSPRPMIQPRVGLHRMGSSMRRLYGRPIHARPPAGS